AESIVARAAVVEGEAVGVGRGRSLREVTRHQVGAIQASREAVDEVIVPVIGAFANLDRSVGMLDDIRLPGPPRTTPHACAKDVVRGRTQPTGRRIAPTDHRLLRQGPLAVVVTRRVSSEGREAGEGRVDGPRGRDGAGAGRGGCRPRGTPTGTRPRCPGR